MPTENDNSLSDEAEEYFKILERIIDPNDPKWRVIIANARNDHRQRSRYTEEYWNQREQYLRNRALERYYSEPRFTIRKWIKRLFRKKP